MRVVQIDLVPRKGDVFIVNGQRIPADRKASDGYGVLVVFESSKLDKDFQPAYSGNCYFWFPTAEQLEFIKQKLDLSDSMTCDYLHNGEGWNNGPRPYKPQKVADFI